VVSSVSANPGGSTVSVAARSGYLFDLPGLRLGPIADIRFSRSTIDDFVEAGDPLLTFQIGGQRLESLVGGIGGQFRVPLRLGDRAASAYLNLTAEREFFGGPSILSLAEVQAPLLPILFALGDPDAPTALFLHGNPTSSYIWRNILPTVAEVAHCIAPDLIGFGQSGKPDIDYGFEDHVRYLDAFLAAKGINSAYVVAQDWGTALAFHLAARRPDFVQALLSWNSPGRFPRGKNF
jgi:hypothetical protein